MAAAFPSERSTKDVINGILDDYEKLTKYVIISLFCYSIVFARCDFRDSRDKVVNPDSLQ